MSPWSDGTVTPQTWVSIVLATVALVALYFTRLSVRNAQQQTKQQREIADAASQPYVWADIRPDERQDGGLLMLVVANEGPTVATDVTVSITPPLREPGGPAQGQPGNDELAAMLAGQGIASLAPRRTIYYPLGGVFAHIPATGTGEAATYTLTIAATGPTGPVKPVRYVIRLEDIRQSSAIGTGSMRAIAKSLDELTKVIKKH